MSEKPEERNRDSRNASKSSIEQADDPPLDKQDPPEPVQVEGGESNTEAAKANSSGRSMAYATLLF